MCGCSPPQDLEQAAVCRRLVSVGSYSHAICDVLSSPHDYDHAHVRPHVRWCTCRFMRAQTCMKQKPSQRAGRALVRSHQVENICGAGRWSQSPRRRGRGDGRQTRRQRRRKQPPQQRKQRGGRRQLPRKTADGQHSGLCCWRKHSEGLFRSDPACMQRCGQVVWAMRSDCWHAAALTSMGCTALIILCMRCIGACGVRGSIGVALD